MSYEGRGTYRHYKGGLYDVVGALDRFVKVEST